MVLPDRPGLRDGRAFAELALSSLRRPLRSSRLWRIWIQGDVWGVAAPRARVHLACPRDLHLDGGGGRAHAQGARAQGGPAGTPARYVDQLASLIFDLTAIQSSEDVGEPISYLAGAAVKSLENYERYMVEETRDLLRELQFKASRTRVLVAWSGDKYEMRADRLASAQSLTEKLRDYVTDVRQVDVEVQDRRSHR